MPYRHPVLPGGTVSRHVKTCFFFGETTKKKKSLRIFLFFVFEKNKNPNTFYFGFSNLENKSFLL